MIPKCKSDFIEQAAAAAVELLSGAGHGHAGDINRGGDVSGARLGHAGAHLNMLCLCASGKFWDRTEACRLPTTGLRALR